MAYSSSIKRAQAIKLCELCQEDAAKWRCIECDKTLCQKCKIIHLRVPVTANHQIVTIGTPLKDVQKKIVTDNIPCQDHPKKMTCLFCRSCDSLICSDCVSSGHKQHNLDSIESALGQKLEYLRRIKDTTGDNLKHCESKTLEIQKIKPKYNAIFDESLTKIAQKERELIDAIRIYSKDLQEKVKNERLQVNNALSKIEQKVDKTKQKMEEQRDNIDAILISNQGGAIYKATLTIEDIKFDSVPNQVKQFLLPSTDSAKKIQELFGSFEKMKIPTEIDLPEMKLQVVRTFVTYLTLIDSLVTLDETSAWIASCERQVIRKVKIEDQNMTTSQEISLNIVDMALTDNNELLLSMFDGSEVKLLKSSGDIVSFMTVAPLIPCGIHVTMDNEVIVGVKELGNAHTPTDKSTRAICVFRMDGQQKYKYQNNKDGKRLFTYPFRITTNNNKDILVIDTTSGKTGRVVVLNRKEILRWVYKGQSKINLGQQFDPRGIVTTKDDLVIISDDSSHALHVLSKDGEVLTCQVLSEIGIRFPCGLSIDNKGRLWLGIEDSAEQNRAKLCIIELKV